MRLRTKEIIDIPMAEKDVKKLRKGYVVYKMVKGKTYCVRPKIKDRKIVREIDKYRKKIAELQKKIGNGSIKKKHKK